MNTPNGPEGPVRSDVLVVGAGLAGLVTSLDLAQLGFKVALVDQQAAHGGTLTLLDRQFTTDSCGFCQILPQDPDNSWGCLKSVLFHPNISFLPLTRLLGVAGQAGSFEVNLRQTTSMVDPKRCTRCGLCMEACPVEIPDPLQSDGLNRKAIGYRSLLCTQSLITVDESHCTRCGACVEACPVDAIDLGATAGNVRLSARAVVLASGFSLFDASLRPEYGYGRLPDVSTTMDLERRLSRAPMDGAKALKRASDGEIPRRIGWIQCVGSRDERNPWCSSVCCMISLKQARMCREILPDAHLEIFYMDLRACGKGYERYLEETVKRGVVLTRARPTEVLLVGKGLMVKVETQQGQLREDPFDMVVLSVGLEPSIQARGLAELIGLEVDEEGFAQLQTGTLSRTSREGVYVVGAQAQPMDIPESVVAAHEAAALVSSALKPPGRATRPYRSVATGPLREEIQALVVLCDCISTLSDAFHWEELVSRINDHPNVKAVHRSSNLCWSDRRDELPGLIEKHGANALIVGACTPRWLEPVLGEGLRASSVDPDMVSFCNIREQIAWVHRGHPEGATRAALSSIEASIERITAYRPLPRTACTEPHKDILVIGGGPAGISAALTASSLGLKVTLVERSSELGGNLRYLRYGADPQFQPQKLLQELSHSAMGMEGIEVLLGTTAGQIKGGPGDFSVSLKGGGSPPQPRRFGAVIVATGASMHIPQSYLYGKNPSVLTQRDLEARVGSGGMDPASLSLVAMIQCVESRGHPLRHCSRICCATALKNALRLIEGNPSLRLFVFQRDMRSLGTLERLYRKAREAGVIFVTYDPQDPPTLSETDGGLLLEAWEPVVGRRLRMRPDLVVLSTGIQPQDQDQAGDDLPRGPEGFIAEVNPKFRPLDISEGIYGCGLAMGPAFLHEAMAQGRAAALRAFTDVTRMSMGGPVRAVSVNPRLCTSCGLCVEVCPYGARELNEELGHAVVREELCQACGTCVATCPNAACEISNTSLKKGILYEIDALLGPRD